MRIDIIRYIDVEGAIGMDDKIYVINDNVEVKEKYLKMSKEERNKAIQAIIEEDSVQRNKLNRIMDKL